MRKLKAGLARLLGISAEKPWETWAATDRYVTEKLRLRDPASEAAARAVEAAGLPPIGVSPTQGKLLELLGRLTGARRILELGTLGGYSTIWLARSLVEGGKVVTIEFDPRFAKVARSNIEAAGLGERVEIRVGAALEVLPQLEGPFDLIFIDADKLSYPSYIDWALKLSRPGTLIVADNVIGGGAIVEHSGPDPWGEVGGVEAVRTLHEKLGAEPRLQVTALQTVGERGYDGFALAVVTEPSAGG